MESEELVTKIRNILRLTTQVALVAILFGAASLWASSPTVAPEKTKAAQGSPENEIVILDVRTPDEYQESAIKGSTNIDVTDSRFVARVQSLDKNKSYKLYCRSGGRSGMAEKLMKDQGFKHVENLGSISQAAKKLGLSCSPKACN